MVRLIDIDALDRAMYHKSFEVDDGRNVWNSGLWIRYKIYEEASREAPTVDAVPVMHGKWIYGNDFPWYTASCSTFGYQRRTDIKTTGWNRWKYCPNCGAMMDAERKEE